MRLARYFLRPVAAAIIFTFAPLTAAAQIPGLQATPAAAPGMFATAPIAVDGFTVIVIAALANPPPGAMPLASRVFLIDGAIADVLATDPDSEQTRYDPNTFRVEAIKEGGEYALVATDDRHKVAPLPILTVTADDARYNNTTIANLAQQWQSRLQSALSQALERRQPGWQKRALTDVVRVAVILAILSLAGVLFFRTLKNRTLAVVVAWSLVLVWGGGITYALLLFPQTIEYGHTILHAAISFAAIIIVAFLFDWLLGIAIRQAVRALATFGVAEGAQARALLRVPTMSRALDGFKRFIIVFVALLGGLSALQIPVASVVTIGGIAAVAIGFAAQTLVRDFLNGLLVLFEDQYVVGDYVAIGSYNGIVEHFSLRVVQLRDSQGNLITIPHSSAIQVVNASRNWSRIDYQLSLDSSADVKKAAQTLKATLDSLKNDDDWGDAVIQPYEWIGLETMTKERSILRAIVRTAPLRQYELRRELNARVIEAFKEAGIPLGADQAVTLLVPMTQSPIPG